ncbi:MAG: hypothetical protein ACYC4P_16680 [Thermoanaerobaculia bacterium]
MSGSARTAPPGPGVAWGPARLLSSRLAITSLFGLGTAGRHVLVAWGWSRGQGAGLTTAGGASLVLLATAWRAALGGSGEGRDDAAVFVLAFAARLAFLVVTLAAWGWEGVFPAGPDATGYLRWGRVVAEGLPGELPDVRGYGAAGTWDVFYIYTLGFLLRALGGSVVAALVAQCALAAAGCVALHRVAREAAPEAAGLVAVLWSFSPHALYFAGGNFLKDSVFQLVVFGAVWAAVGALRASGPALLAWLLLGLTFLVAVRTTRGYFGILLGGLLVLLPVAAGMRNDGLRKLLARKGAGLAAIVLFVAGSEAVVWALGFPAGPTSLVRRTANAWRRPEAVHGYKGFAEGVLAPSRGRTPEGRREGTDSTSPRGMTRGADFADGTGRVDALAGSARSTASERADAVPVAAGPERSSSRLLDVFRRTVGPYVWTPPTSGFRRLFVAGDVPAWLNVPLWYWAAPLGLLGLLPLLREGRWVGWLVVAMSVLFGATLLVFNVSHRQRDSVLLPFLLIPAAACWLRLDRRARQRALAGVATVLIALAALYWGLQALRG